jgi:hypothetical protein
MTPSADTHAHLPDTPAAPPGGPARLPDAPAPPSDSPARLPDAPALPPDTPSRVLVVAHKTAAGPSLLDAVRARAAKGPCVFTLLVPNAAHGLLRVTDPEDRGTAEARAVLDRSLPALSEAAGAPVEGIVGDPDPTAAVHDALNLRGFDEVIVSTLSPRISRWLRLDLPSKVAGMGLPVTTVTPREGRAKHAA